MQHMQCDSLLGLISPIYYPWCELITEANYKIAKVCFGVSPSHDTHLVFFKYMQ